MVNKLEDWQPEAAAKKYAASLKVMLASGREFSPGQWQLLEDQMDRILVDPHTKEEFKVSDYL